jgi:hypothetical protein
MLELFRWLGSSPLSTAIRQSRWAFAAIEIIHLMGLALLGGTALIIAFRLMGAGLTRAPVASIARGLLPAALTGLAVLLTSGVLLLADGPLRYYANTAFRTKMTLLPLALLVSVPVLRMAIRTPASADASAALRAGAAVALLLWLSVAVAGRVIGVL